MKGKNRALHAIRSISISDSSKLMNVRNNALQFTELHLMPCAPVLWTFARTNTSHTHYHDGDGTSACVSVCVRRRWQRVALPIDTNPHNDAAQAFIQSNDVLKIEYLEHQPYNVHVHSTQADSLIPARAHCRMHSIFHAISMVFVMRGDDDHTTSLC